MTHPASADEAALLAEFLEADDELRRITVRLLERRLKQANGARGQVLCHRPCGLYVLLPIPVARWLLAGLVKSLISQAESCGALAPSP